MRTVTPFRGATTLQEQINRLFSDAFERTGEESNLTTWAPAVDIYGLVSPPADRRLLARPELKAMFLDDLLNGSRKQLAAPFADVVVFARYWGFHLDQVKVPVRWWHGDHDHIVPFAHGQHVVARLPDAELYHLPGESHLAGLGRGEEILRTMLDVWDRDDQR